MRLTPNRWIACAIVLLTSTAASRALAQVVPGSGHQVTQVGDDLEGDDEWKFHLNFPKSSEEQDEQSRYPLGRSANGRWMEGPKRGAPDYMRVVDTPEGGIPGSKKSLLVRTLHSGIPGRLTYKMQQDDLLIVGSARMGGQVSVGRTPSCVVRVYMPPFEQWEDRSGPTFAVRAGIRTTTTKSSGRGFLSRSQTETEPYWPGIFVQFRSKTDRRYEEDSAYFTIRATRSGGDFKGPEITQLGWWTLGMSFTPDGRVHYYAKPGVENLTSADYLGSQYPYGFRAERFNTMFFNVCNMDDGKTWSTPWIIDDPAIFTLR